MAKKLKYECEFCGTPTNFEDMGHQYCVDCYVKIAPYLEPPFVVTC